MTLSVPHFAGARVLVVGDVILDRYWYGHAARISREAPVPVVNVQEVEERPGGAANVAVNIAALGATPVLLGLTGDDEAANALGELLRGPGVEFLPQRVPGFRTVTKMRVLSQHQQLIRLDFEAPVAAGDTDALVSRYRERVADAGVVVLSDYGNGALAEVGEFIQYARRADTPVLVDPRGRDFSRYRGATVITPNLAEFEGVVGRCRDVDEIAGRGDRLRRELDAQALLITRGEYGMTLLQAGQSPLQFPAKTREVYDVTGAGDTVIGVLAAALAAGEGLTQAVSLSNVAAGIVVSKLGTAAATADEIEHSLFDRGHLGGGVMAEEDLLKAIKSARAGGEKIVMTNGCFDILHAGHVSHLAKAKELGRRLIVAVNDDASVQRLKGRGRPVNSLARRMAVLSGLESVDWVVPFSEDTPERLICAAGPDILVKGGDYASVELPGAECVRARGGEVRILDFEPGCSTSAIIETINRDARG